MLALVLLYGAVPGTVPVALPSYRYPVPGTRVQYHPAGTVLQVGTGYFINYQNIAYLQYEGTQSEMIQRVHG